MNNVELVRTLSWRENALLEERKKAFSFVYGAPMPFLIQLLLGYHKATYNLHKNTPGHIILYYISFAYITNSLYLCKSFVGVGKCLQ